MGGTTTDGIAIIGAAGRFPGSRNLDEFWDNLRRGVESVTFFSHDELRAEGIEPDVLGDPRYVKAAPVLDGIDRFDAAFFDCSPREARLTDPQHRLFLECAWEALENAGYNPLAVSVPVGVYGGAGGLVSSYLLWHAAAGRHIAGPTGGLSHIANDKDFLTTRVSYKLNLKGPSINIQSACSTSLVAVHVACQGLLGRECDMALAGGVTIRVPQRSGYFHEPGGIVSPDGHCRTFDAAAQGTIFGSGVGIVVLKRLADALADGDAIRAVIKGTAVNNDGGSKLSYTAASEAGQAGAIAEALALAGFDPQSVGLIEAHGTATALGDPVEVSALTRVFRSRTPKTTFCAIGSVKSNIGHCEAAAGIAGLLKTMLALEHRQLPATLHVRTPNPRIRFDDSPFHVNTSLSDWAGGETPRRAGVNCVGIGGTNAFVALEEAPQAVRRSGQARPFQLFCLAAKTEPALMAAAHNYVEHLDGIPEERFEDVCFTAALGRMPFTERLAIVADSISSLKRALAETVEGRAVENLSRGRAIDGNEPEIALHGQLAGLSSLGDKGEDPRQSLTNLGELWVRGVKVDWGEFYHERGVRRIALPTYPFERERYWLDEDEDESLRASVSTRPKTQVHGPLVRRLPSPLKDLQFESRLGAALWPLLGDHRIYGQVVVPGAWHLSAVLAAAREFHEPGIIALGDVVFPQALVLDDDEPRTVQLIFTPAPDGASFSFQVLSLEYRGPAKPGNDHQQAAWMLHAQGRLAVVPSAVCEAGAHATPEEIQARCPRTLDLAEFYVGMHDRQIDLGPAFRWHASVVCSDDESLGRTCRPADVGDVQEFVLHPGLLDSCFQLPIAMLDSTHVPLSIERLEFSPAAGEASWCHARFTRREKADPESATAEIGLFDATGNTILRVEGLSIKRANRSALLKGKSGKTIESWFHNLEWRHIPPAEVQHPSAGSAGRWLILADSRGVGKALAAALEHRGHSCELVCDRVSAGELLRILEHGDLRGIVHLWALDAADNAELDTKALEFARTHCCVSAMRLVQELTRAKLTSSPRLWIVTRGAQAVPPAGVAAVAQAPLWGLGRVTASEHPGFRPTLVDLDPHLRPDDAQGLLDLLLGDDDEDQIALRGGRRYVARLAGTNLDEADIDVLPIPADRPIRLQIPDRGVLNHLQVRPTERRQPLAGEVEIRAHAAGLNFRDVLNALGTYPGDPGELGLECAGVVTAVGPKVTGLHLGDEVMAIAFGSFSSHVTTPAVLVCLKPVILSFEEAAATPVVFLTALYAFNHLARLSADSRVLIHAAAGGVGLAAVQLAQAVGAEIFATAGSDEKREYLRSLGIEHVMSSRTAEFADEVLKRSGGKGVDVVLNSLSGDLIRSGLRTLAPGGCFVELGKIGMWDPQRVAAFRPDISYWTLALDTMFHEQPALVGSLLGKLAEGLASRRLRPLPARVYPLAKAVGAFRYMSQAKHIGKIVLSMPAEQGNTASGKAPSVRSDASYLITGGLGGLGLLVARWLVSRGVRHLLLAGRASPSPAARQVLDELERSGVQVRVEQADVSQGEHVARLLAAAATLPPLRGVIHAAGILDDGILFEQDDERLAKVMAPKVEGAWNLHVQTRAIPLDFFVLFSSMASLLGSAGQGNYAAGNAFLDALAHLRRAQNLPAQSVNWGPWAQAGMAAALGHAGAQRFADRGVELIAPEAGLEALGEVLVRNPIQVAVLPIDWEHYARAVDNGRASPLLRELVRERPRTRRSDDPAQIESPPERLARELSCEPLRDRLRSQVQEHVVRVLGLDPSQPLGGRKSLTDLGLDSLMAVELVNALAKATGHRLPSDLVFNRPTVEVLTDYLAIQSQKARSDDGSRAAVAEPAAAPSPRPTVPAPAFARRDRFGMAGPLAKIAALIKPNRRQQ